MSGPKSAERPATILVAAAFAAIYIIWGSTYLAIRVAVGSIPPFVMAGVRFLIAGTIMYALVRIFGRERPTWRNWRAALIVGGLLLLGGNGMVCWAEQTVPSGLAALLITTVPIWMVLLHWMRRDGRRPTLSEGAGVALGFLGVVMLIGMGDLAPGESLDRIGALGLVAASLSWSFGSLYSRSASLPKSPFLATAMEMLCGGMLLTLTGVIRGEFGRVNLAAIPPSSLVALAYLIVFGSLIAFTAYVWLLGVTTPARVATYAFVNPVVAVLLGCTILGEPFSPRFIVASVIIVVAVTLVITSRARTPAGVVGSPAPKKLPQEGVLFSQGATGTATALGRDFAVSELQRRRQIAGRPYYEFLRSDSMSAGLYSLPAGGEDFQQPHEEDEIYVVLEGASDFRMGESIRSVEAGSVLFVPAHLPHRFEQIREDLTMLVLFAPAESISADAREPEVAECC